VFLVCLWRESLQTPPEEIDPRTTTSAPFGEQWYKLYIDGLKNRRQFCVRRLCCEIHLGPPPLKKHITEREWRGVCEAKNELENCRT